MNKNEIKDILKSKLLSKTTEAQNDKLYRKVNDVLNIVRTRQANYIFGTEEEEHQERKAVIRAMRKLASALKSKVIKDDLKKDKKLKKQEMNTSYEGPFYSTKIKNSRKDKKTLKKKK